MKKFYIPTSTLNFNNILSSESISPKAFYEKREFGYSRWTTIPENPFKNVIVLYENPCFFDRPKSDMEDHPMLIEIDIDEEKLTKSNGFWYSDRTIFLSPSTAQFFFFTKEDMITTLSRSAASSETKLLRLYQGKWINTISKPSESYKPIQSEEPCELNIAEIEHDRQTNKMKGLLYGYYIGALLSMSIDDVKHLNELREIHNIFAAIQSSFDKIPTPYQDERLDVLFRSLNRNNADIQDVYKTIGNDAIAEQIINKPYFQARNLYRKSDFLYHLHNAELSGKRQENPSISWIKGELQKHQSDIYKKRDLLSTDKEEIVVVDNKLTKCSIIKDETERKLMLAWCNETLSGNDINGKISTYRKDLADLLTHKAKDVIGDDAWVNHKVRKFLNDLRQYIGGNAFEHPWNNGLLSSIAAVVLKGEDRMNMLSFMQGKEMTDYRLAFALYGVIYGFANMTRDFTDVLLEEANKNYVWEVYKEFFGQLFGGDLPERNGEERPIEQIDSTDTNVEHDDASQVENSMQQSEEPTNADNLEHKVSSIPEELKLLFDSEVFKKLSLPAQQYYKKEALALYQGKVDKTYIESLKALEYCKTTIPKWKKTIKVLEQKQKKESHPGLFPFYSDESAFDCLLTILPNDQEVQKQFKIDLKWFQNNYKQTYWDEKKGQQVEGKYRDNPKDNVSVIDHFNKFLINKRNNQKFAPIYNKIDIAKIVNKLYELYK